MLRAMLGASSASVRPLRAPPNRQKFSTEQARESVPEGVSWTCAIDLQEAGRHSDRRTLVPRLFGYAYEERAGFIVCERQ